MLGFVIFAILCASLTRADAKPVKSDGKSRCIEQFLQWCNTTDYVQSGGVYVQSSFYQDSTGAYVRVMCDTDSGGISCTRNGSPWFECSTNRSLTYKGRPLTPETEVGQVDDDVCRSAEKAFGDMMIQNLTVVDSETLREFQDRMGDFYQEMASLEQQLNELYKRLTAPFLPGGDFVDGIFSPTEVGDASPSASEGSSVSDSSEEDGANGSTQAVE